MALQFPLQVERDLIAGTFQWFCRVWKLISITLNLHMRAVGDLRTLKLIGKYWLARYSLTFF